MAEQEGILSDEQVNRIKARERKRNQRAREKAAKNDAHEETPEVFWKRNRELANQTLIAELLERQECVFALLEAMSAAMTESVSPELLFPDEVDQDVKADIGEHGICEMEVYLLNFWQEPKTFQMLMAHPKTNAATKAFVRCGLVTAIPGHRLHAWETWLQSRTPSKPQPSNLYTSIQCACGSLPVVVQQEVVDRYQELKIPFKCHNCINTDALFKVAATEQKNPANQIFDSWGRVKDR